MPLASFVDGSSNDVASSSASELSAVWLASAERRAAFIALRLTFRSKLRGTLANT